MTLGLDWPMTLPAPAEAPNPSPNPRHPPTKAVHAVAVPSPRSPASLHLLHRNAPSQLRATNQRMVVPGVHRNPPPIVAGAVTATALNVVSITATGVMHFNPNATRAVVAVVPAVADVGVVVKGRQAHRGRDQSVDGHPLLPDGQVAIAAATHGASHPTEAPRPAAADTAVLRSSNNPPSRVGGVASVAA